MAAHTVPYLDPFSDGAVRPYLALHVTGINGQSGNIPGLLDSGADRTSLPFGYAALMGYTAADLEADQARIADGSTIPTWTAKIPSEAFAVGLPQPTFDLWPTFVPGNATRPLWGRADVFQAFPLLFNEAQQSFTLSA